MWHNVLGGLLSMASPQMFEMIGIAPRSDFDLARITEEGISTDSLSALKDRGLTFSEISEIIISPRTLKHRKARREPLSHEETDRVVRVARVLSLAEDVFASREKALQWLRMPDERLENRTPLKMLTTESGGRLVENMLWQIDEGIYT
jgi:putative toxin-antitoxin system antitoxin component (TIGR02293 family)